MSMEKYVFFRATAADTPWNYIPFIINSKKLLIDYISFKLLFYNFSYESTFSTKIYDKHAGYAHKK